MKVVYASSALEDLDAIDAWIARDDPARAIMFVRGLQDAADDLADAPLRFPLVDARRYPGVHRRNHRGYRILYRVSPDEVLILHIHHGRRQIPELSAR